MTHDDNLARVKALRDDHDRGPRCDIAMMDATLDHIEDVLTRHAPHLRATSGSSFPGHTPTRIYVCGRCRAFYPCPDYASALALFDALDGGSDE